MEEGQELHCHSCDRYVQFVLDLSVDGNYILKCPNCGHPHYRMVREGRITDSRWYTANTIQIFARTSTPESTFQMYSNSRGTNATSIGYQMFLDKYTGVSST